MIRKRAAKSFVCAWCIASGEVGFICCAPSDACSGTRGHVYALHRVTLGVPHAPFRLVPEEFGGFDLAFPEQAIEEFSGAVVFGSVGQILVQTYDAQLYDFVAFAQRRLLFNKPIHCIYMVQLGIEREIANELVTAIHQLGCGSRGLSSFLGIDLNDPDFVRDIVRVWPVGTADIGWVSQAFDWWVVGKEAIPVPIVFDLCRQKQWRDRGGGQEDIVEFGRRMVFHLDRLRPTFANIGGTDAKFGNLRKEISVADGCEWEVPIQEVFHTLAGQFG